MRLLAEPAPHIGGLGRRDRRARIRTAPRQPPPASSASRIAAPGLICRSRARKRVERAGIGDQIGLGQDDAVGDRDLLDRLDMARRASRRR